MSRLGGAQQNPATLGLVLDCDGYLGGSCSGVRAVEDTLTIPLTPELRAAVDHLTETEGLSPEGLVERALQEFVFVHQFRSLRDQLLQKAQADYTDDDTFEMVS